MWKLKTSANATTATALFDLTTNPGEEERLNFVYNKCVNPNPQQDLQITNVINKLKSTESGNVSDWLQCVNDANCTTPY